MRTVCRSDSESWQRSDSTDNDFDSDEFDTSDMDKVAMSQRRRRSETFDKDGKDNVIVPEIVVDSLVDDDGATTGDEIDTRLLDGTSTPASSCHVTLTQDETVTNGSQPAHSSSESESDTLADDLSDKKRLPPLPLDDKTPTREDLPPLEAPSEDKDEDETNTSVSSLSCCDVSGTFDDINLVSMIEEDTATATNTSTTPRTTNTAAGGSPRSTLASCGSLTMTNSANHVAYSTSGSGSTYTPSRSTQPLTNSLLSSSHKTETTSSTTGTPGVRQTAFKVAQPKFTVFNFDDYKLPPVVRQKQLINNEPNSSIIKSPSATSVTPRTGATSGTVKDCAIAANENKHVPASTTTPVVQQKSPPGTQDKEMYSKIPILASRVAAAATGASNTSGVPSYSGSFTEKLLQRCRSTPTMKTESPLAKWSFNLNLASASDRPSGTLSSTPMAKQTTTPNLRSTMSTSTSKPLSEPKQLRTPTTEAPPQTGVPFVDSELPSPADSKHKESSMNVHVPPKRTKPLSTVSPPIPFYERLAKELLENKANSVSEKSTKSAPASKSTAFRSGHYHAAPRAILDELDDDQEHHHASPTTTGSGDNRLHIIESKLKKDRTSQDEQLLRQWFKIKNGEQ